MLQLIGRLIGSGVLLFIDHFNVSKFLSINMPDVFIVAGPNGAGKTTSAMSLFPDLLECIEYVNADAIASGISPFKPAGVAVEAGRLMLQRIKKLAIEDKSFAFETTLSSKCFVKLLNKCKNSGYTTTLLYIWLKSPSLAINRVKDRVLNGGHSIPEDTIRRRYYRSIYNLIDLYLPLVNNAYLFDNSDKKPSDIAQKEGDGEIEVLDRIAWGSIQAVYNGNKK